MKVLVTGAGGYIGRHVVNELIRNHQKVIAVGHNVKITPDDNVTVLNTDIFEKNINLYQQLDEPDVCIHLAWRDGFVHNSKSHMSNLSEHFDFLTNMIDNGLKSLSVMGTMHEIGYWEGMIDENTPCNPQSQYGIAKNALRQSLLLYTEGLKCSFHWLRAYYITGDDLNAKSIFSKISQAALSGKTSFPFNSGKNKYDFIDVDELSKMIVAASLQSEFNGIINVCSGQPMSLSDRVDKYIKDQHYSIKLDYGAFPDRTYDSPIVYGNNKIIKTIMKNYNCL